MSPLPKYFDGIRLPRYVFFLSLGCLMLFSGVHVGLILLLYRLGCSDIVLVHLVLLYWVLVAVGLTKYIQWYTRRFYEKPIRRIAEAAGKVAGGDFSVYLPPVHTPDHLDCLDALTEDFNRMVEALGSIETLKTEFFSNVSHEIKTPIAAMRLTLQGEDTPAARRLMTELGRVEQYVDMALTYLRLEEGGSDYVIRTCAVDDVVRAAVRRFAGEFIDRRIALDYTPVEWETVTDGKWLTFVVEQLLSNALKYTGQDGTVRIYREGDDLCIRDSGMGIAPEDLPRVFDMGYTGQNGRLDRRSSGIGLYLCRRICRNLRHEIRIESVPGVGTTVYLTLGRGDFLPE